DERCLAGECREFDIAIHTLGDVPRQRGLARSGVAEQSEDLGRAVPPGPRLEPRGNGLQRGLLMRRKCGHEDLRREWNRTWRLADHQANHSCAWRKPPFRPWN